jgi:hypothetical protein
VQKGERLWAQSEGMSFAHMIEGGIRLHHGMKALFLLSDTQGQFDSSFPMSCALMTQSTPIDLMRLYGPSCRKSRIYQPFMSPDPLDGSTRSPKCNT